ncbi:MAG: hypothetical protein V4637_11220 [Pseudomonadota bacterium]
MRAKARELAEARSTGVEWNTQPLGKVTDKELADRLGVPYGTVAAARVKRGIPVFKKWDVASHTPETKPLVAYLSVQNGRQAHRANDVPPDYVGDFIEPLRPELCCVVKRQSRNRKTIPPERCLNRRKSAHHKGDESLLCCSTHVKREGEAVDWANSKGGELVAHNSKGG